MAELICKNCSNTIEENFCSLCGQKKFKRINHQYVIDEVQYLAIHTNKGFFYSVKNILKNPGLAAREFIEGNRVNYYKPLNLAFLLSGISAFLSFKFLNFMGMMGEYYSKMGMSVSTSNSVMSFITSYMTVFTLLLIPIFSFFTYLLFKKWGQNYYEHIVMGSFFQCFHTLISIIIFYPLLFIFNHNVSAFTNIVLLQSLTAPFLLTWFYKGFYPDKKWTTIFWKVILFFLLIFAAYMLIIITFVVGKIILK